jgi:DNA repair exonuclease SbcCD ATPase subunit
MANMIDDEQYSSFKFNGDDEPESEQTLYQDEAKERRIDKLSHRVTIISILIPVLIGAVFYISYRDITSRVSQSQDTGSMEIQNLSSQLQDKFDETSLKYGELEASLVQKLAALEKVDKAMKTNLKKAEDTVSTIKATKADKKDQQDAIAKIDTALSPIRKELKDLSTMRNDLKILTAELQSLDTDVHQKLTTMSANLDKALQNLTTIQSDMSALSNQKLGKDALQLELLKAKKSYQKELDLTKRAIDKRLASILRKIRDLEKIAQAPLATPKSSGGTSSAGSGNIVEQEIKE